MPTKTSAHEVIVRWIDDLTIDDLANKTSEQLADELMGELKIWAVLSLPEGRQ